MNDRWDFPEVRKVVRALCLVGINTASLLLRNKKYMEKIKSKNLKNEKRC